MTAVVIPAHNEAANIGAVLAAAIGANVGPVIVVADSCDDDTAYLSMGVASSVVVIDAGDKGSAMAAGLSRVTDDATLFVDADVRGLKPEHVEALAIAPPAGGMVVGLRDGAPATGLPPISGERRLPTEFARSIPLAGSGYRAELLIDAAVARAGLPHRHYELVGVTNPSREWRHPLMWGDLGVFAIANAPALIRYTVGSARAS